MVNQGEINFSDIFQIQNLMSLLRILLAPVAGYFLWLNSDHATLMLVALLSVAALTDYLDGYLARKLNRLTRLGLFLDPLADKIFATILIIELVFLRDFPLWLAILIFSRDIIILLGASRMIKKRDFVPYSINSGKYFFASLAVLIISYVIKFLFGQKLFLYITLFLYIISSYEYIRNYLLIISGRKITKTPEYWLYKYIRGALTIIVTVIYLYKLFEQLIGFN